MYNYDDNVNFNPCTFMDNYYVKGKNKTKDRFVYEKCAI